MKMQSLPGIFRILRTSSRDNEAPVKARHVTQTPRTCEMAANASTDTRRHSVPMAIVTKEIRALPGGPWLIVYRVMGREKNGYMECSVFNNLNIS